MKETEKVVDLFKGDVTRLRQELKEGSSGTAIQPLSAVKSETRARLGELYYELLELLGQDNFDIDFNQSSIVIKPRGEYIPGFEYTPYLQSLTEYMEKEGIKVKPLPKVVVKKTMMESSDFFRKTAEYSPQERKITLYTEGRHPKDVVRSFAHEMVHHSQELENRLGTVTTSNVNEDEGLQKLEEEAYLKSNIVFRKWEDSEKNKK